MGENLKRCRFCPEKRGMKVSKLRGRGKVMNVDGLHTWIQPSKTRQVGWECYECQGRLVAEGYQQE